MFLSEKFKLKRGLGNVTLGLTHKVTYPSPLFNSNYFNSDTLLLAVIKCTVFSIKCKVEGLKWKDIILQDNEAYLGNNFPLKIHPSANGYFKFSMYIFHLKVHISIHGM